MSLYVPGEPKTVAVALTIDTSIYAANDVVGGLLTFDDVGGVAGGGEIKSILIADADNEKAAAALYLFRSSPTAILDQAAFAPVIADLKALVYVQPILASEYNTKNNLAYALYAPLADIPYTTTTNKLYGYLVCTATPTYTATTDLTVTITVRKA